MYKREAVQLQYLWRTYYDDIGRTPVQKRNNKKTENKKIRNTVKANINIVHKVST